MSDAPISELVNQLFQGLSSPASQELYHCIITKNRREAGKIISEEGFSDKDDRKRLMDHFEEKWSYKSMKLIPITDHSQIQMLNIMAFKFDDNDAVYPPRYLVRKADSVFISLCYLDRGDTKPHFRASDMGGYMFEIDEVDDIFEIRLEK